MPAFNTLAQYIQAAASGSRDSLLHLFWAIFAIVRATVALLARHYQAHSRALTPNILHNPASCAHITMHPYHHRPPPVAIPISFAQLPLTLAGRCGYK